MFHYLEKCKATDSPRSKHIPTKLIIIGDILVSSISDSFAASCSKPVPVQVPGS